MSSFTIYTMGDAKFLYEILNSLAIITATDSFTKMVSIGLLLGIIFMMIQSLFQGAKEINFHQILMGYILYAIMFVPTATVVIQDNYTGYTDVVSDVPIGVAAAGSIVSTVGMNVADMFVTNYQTIGAENGRFAETLKILNNTRRKVSNERTWGALNATAGSNADYRASWRNYIQECTLVGIDSGALNVDKVFGGSMPDALKFDSGIYHTEINLGTKLVVPCTDAWSMLKPNTHAALGTQLFTDAYTGSLGIEKRPGDSAPSLVTDSLMRIGQDSTDARNFLFASMLEPIYLEAATGKYKDFQDSSSAIMLNQAIMQRNTQWAAEHSMFMTVARPLMTFFEGFVYAITPFIAFLIVIGSFGAGIAVKYLQTLLWIQLWMPVMAIINLYINTAASNQLIQQVGTGNFFDSFYALSSGSDVLSHWIAVGGMLAASTPMISLFVVSGSTYAMTSLVGGLKGGDSINEKITTPDAVNPAAAMDVQSGHNYNAITGMSGNGAAQMMGNISMGSSLNKSVQSASQNLESSQQGFSETLGNTLKDDISDSSTYSQLSSLGATASAGKSASSDLVNSRANKLMEQNQIASQHSNAVKGIITATASGALEASVGTKMINALTGTKTDKMESSEDGATGTDALAASKQVADTTSAGIKVGGGLKADAVKATDDTKTVSGSSAAATEDALSFNESERSDITNSLAHSIGNASKDDLSKISANTDTQALQKSAQNVNQSQKSLAQASGLAKTFEGKDTYGLQEIGERVARNSDSSKILNEGWSGVSQSTKDEANELYNLYSTPQSEGGYGLSPENALASSRLKALSNTANQPNTTDRDIQNNSALAMKAIGAATGISTPDLGDYNENSGLPNIENKGLNNKVEEATKGIPKAVEKAGQLDSTKPLPKVDGHGGDPVTQANQGSQIIKDQGNRNNQQLKSSAQEKSNAKYAKAEDGARNRFESTAPEYSYTGAQEIYGGVDNAIQFANRRFTAIEEAGQGAWEGIKAGTKASSAAFNEKLQELTENPELAKAVINAADKSQEELRENGGLAGKFLSGMSEIGRGIIGAAAETISSIQDITSTGQEFAENGDAKISDLSNYSLQDQGAIYSAALAHAASTGGEAAVEAFQDRHQTDFHDQFVQKAMGAGLTETQAELYANSYDNQFDLGDQKLGAAKDAFYSEYAEKDDNGNVIRDEDGAPVLTQENQVWADKLMSSIFDAGRATPETSEAYMTGIARYNRDTGRVGGLMENFGGGESAPAATAAPMATETPKEPAAAPMATETPKEPAAAPAAAPMAAPMATETPTPAPAPMATETPAATAAPMATETPAATAAPMATETPAATAAPMATETPKEPAAAPMATETPKEPAAAPMAAPMATETPAATAAPMATETPKEPAAAPAAAPMAAPMATETPTPAPAPMATETPKEPAAAPAEGLSDLGREELLSKLNDGDRAYVSNILDRLDPPNLTSEAELQGMDEMDREFAIEMNNAVMQQHQEAVDMKDSGALDHMLESMIKPEQK